MPFSVLCHYILAKFQRECYELDCAWAAATGFHFVTSNKPKEPEQYPMRPTLSCWAEFSRPARQQVIPQTEKVDVFAEIDAMAAEG